MSTAVDPPFLVASFTNERLGLCANVREIPDFEEHELLVVDAFSGEVVIMRRYPDRDQAVEAAKAITGIVPS
ncbi:hypothetical protein H7849_18345 [Alloacidobacterium dinghuense]|uniref:Uncharacterized protein n=1 Tax=Alloacidobacterium dinghuense TaxID=2763107 RepID=A0A7G8BET0_9BACT|nr:hypothetical protein [Alloacidobacterium dinghuense]QNI31050.1 hypothetical protein H7849_18345 [Alloacidobacterium dinghuense]